jgi:hypothetical protein
MEIGTIIRIRQNVHNYPEKDGNKYQYIYYQLVDGDFEVINNDIAYKFNGRHFVCMGSDFFINMFGQIAGLELLDNEFEVIDTLPKGLL